jgi:hypothetical protein
MLGPLLLLSLAAIVPAWAQAPVGVTELASNLLVFATGSGNVVASVGPDGAFLTGTPSADSTAEISRILASRTKSGVRYVVIAAEDVAHSQGDAGWVRRGAFVAMQENALGRLGGHVMGAPRPLPQRLLDLGVSRPPISFSDVLSFDLNGEAIHVVHQSPGYSDADTIVHFHVAKVVYLGEVFPGDGYPEVDRSQGGDLAGLLKTLEPWTGTGIRVVPARGKAVDGIAVKSFVDTIVAVRDQVQRMIASGLGEQQIVAQHPSAKFDAQWGHGRVSPDAFVKEIYLALVSLAHQ